MLCGVHVAVVFGVDVGIVILIGWCNTGLAVGMSDLAPYWEFQLGVTLIMENTRMTASTLTKICTNEFHWMCLQ